MQKTKRRQRRLTHLQVDEVSLVANPAVREASFVIAKRDADVTVDDRVVALIHSIGKSIGGLALQQRLLTKRIDVELVARGLRTPTVAELIADPCVVDAFSRLADRMTQFTANFAMADRWSTSLASPCSGCRQTGFSSFLDQPPLELSQGGENVQDQLAGSRRRVDHPIGNRAESDPPFLQILDHVHEMTHRPPQSVETPDDERVSGSQCFVTGGQPWPIFACSRTLVAVEVLLRDTVCE